MSFFFGVYTHKTLKKLNTIPRFSSYLCPEGLSTARLVEGATLDVEEASAHSFHRVGPSVTLQSPWP